ncbi:MAG: hypothetical protein ACRYGG_18725 [Janthinobacterium lividum]
MAQGFAKTIRALERFKGTDSELKALALDSVKNTGLDDLFKSLNFTIIKNVPHINNIKGPVFTNLIKLARYEEGFKQLSPTFEITPNIRTYLNRELDVLPEFHLRKNVEIENSLKQFENVKDIDEFIDILKADPKLDKKLTEEVGKKISNGKLYGRTFTFSIVGLGIYAAVDRARRELGGCIRYTRTPEGMKSCKVKVGSCAANIIGEIPECQQNEITPDQQTANCNLLPKSPCRKCDSNETDPKAPNFIADRDKIPENVYYKCYQATFQEALGDVLDNVIDVSGGFLSNLGTLIKLLPKILLYVIPGIFIIFISIFLFKLIPNKNSNY